MTELKNILIVGGIVAVAYYLYKNVYLKTTASKLVNDSLEICEEKAATMRFASEADKNKYLKDCLEKTEL